MLKAEIGQRQGAEVALQHNRDNLQALVDVRTRDLLESESRFRAAFDQAAVGIAHFDLQNVYTLVNRRYCEIVGYPPEALQGKTSGFLNHPDDHGMGSDQRRQLRIGTIEHFSQDKRYLRQDGAVIWVTRTESLARDAAGAPQYYIRVIEDISARKQAEQARTQLAAIVENSNDAIISRTLDGTILSWNAGAEKMLGYAAAEVIGQPIFLTTPQGQPLNLPEINARVLRGEAMVRESNRRTKDGRLITVSIHYSPLRDAAGNITGVSVIMQDITALKQSEEARSLLAAVAESSGDAIFIRDTDRKIIYWNEGACRLYGYTPEEVMGKDSTFLVPPELMAEREQNWIKRQQGLAVANPDTVRVRKDGTKVDVSISLSFVKDVDGKVIGAATIARDITERKNAERHIERLATRDVLTGLANRHKLMEQMHAALARAARAKTQLAVMFVDLDRFKVVNDTLGHAAGDELLRECAQRLTECVREVDIVARLGGDEFVVLLTDLADTAIVYPIADRMRKSLTMTYQLQGQEVQASASIGICFYPADGHDVTTLMKNADIAMYHAKDQGRNNYQFFAEEMNQRMVRRAQLERELRSALVKQEFVLHYQPQIALDSGEIQGVESLISWRHPLRGLLPPAEFIALAEETGLIVPMGEWVLNHACRTIKSWRAKDVAIPYVVVNVSAAQLGEGLVRSVRQALLDHAIEPSWLMLEITETMLMEHVEEAISLYATHT